MTICRMRFACWISQATRSQAHAYALAHPHLRTHSCTHAHGYSRSHAEIRSTHCFSTSTVVSWTPFNVTLYVHCVSCCWVIARNLLVLHRSICVVNKARCVCARLCVRAFVFIRSDELCCLMALSGSEWKYRAESVNCRVFDKYKHHISFRVPRLCWESIVTHGMLFKAFACWVVFQCHESLEYAINCWHFAECTFFV